MLAAWRVTVTVAVLSLGCGPGLGAAALGPPPAIVAFSDGEYDGYTTWNWTALTHVGFWTKPGGDVRALAKQHGVRLFADSHLPDPKTWTDSDQRKSFAAAKVQQVQKDALDGVFFDYEGQLTPAQQKGYGELAQEVSKQLAAVNATIFICVGGRPGYEFRNYDYTTLSSAAEFLFIMGYDLHFWDDYTCVTKGTCSLAEAPLKDLTDGVDEYLKGGVDKHKLVLGLPWYGQRYDRVAGVPFNVGEIGYKDVLANVDAKKFKSKSFDKGSSTWKAVCVSGGCLQSSKQKKATEIWFDDAQSLIPKYGLAASHNLLGVGVWQVSNLPIPDSSGKDPHAQARQDMWSALVHWREHDAAYAAARAA